MVKQIQLGRVYFGMPKVTVETIDKTVTLQANTGDNLRRLLLNNGLSPYGKWSTLANCGGRGLCATCGIIPVQGVHKPVHWHDKLANDYRYPRLSCQIQVQEDMRIRLVTDKIMWGKRIKKATGD